MATFTLITKNGATVNVSITEEQAFAFVKAEIEKLQEKLDELNGLDSFEASEIAVKALKTKINKLEEADKLDASYTYEELKARTYKDGNQFKAYLKQNGIDETLLNSAERAMKEGLKALEYLKIAQVTDRERIRLAVLNAVKGQNSKWHELTINWLLNDDEDGQELAV